MLHITDVYAVLNGRNLYMYIIYKNTHESITYKRYECIISERT